jgi:hypothetical protein
VVDLTLQVDGVPRDPYAIALYALDRTVNADRPSPVALDYNIQVWLQRPGCSDAHTRHPLRTQCTRSAHTHKLS